MKKKKLAIGREHQVMRKPKNFPDLESRKSPIILCVVRQLENPTKAVLFEDYDTTQHRTNFPLSLPLHFLKQFIESKWFLKFHSMLSDA